MSQLQLNEIFQALSAHFGPQHWWPGETPFEIMVGAVLTQNTNWTNVEKAIDNLKRENLLSLEAVSALPIELLAEKIRPSGYYNLKAKRLINLLSAISQTYGDLESLFAEDLNSLREFLLSVKGIGLETADSIILYAAQKPIFVIDAYTYRILSRHNLVGEETDYYEMQALFMDSLPHETDLFNEYHALIVMCGKHYCKKTKPLCDSCPLQGM